MEGLVKNAKLEKKKRKQLRCFFCSKILREDQIEDWIYTLGPDGNRVPACKSHPGVKDNA